MTRDSHTPLLEVSGLDVTFRSGGKKHHILRNISFSLESDRTLGIVGESGSGKTVTALSILNLIPSPPLDTLSGEIRFHGENLIELTRSRMRLIRGARISYIYQEPLTALNPVLTIGDQIVEMIRAHTRLGRREAFDKAAGLLDEVGIPSPTHRMRNYPHEMSGGMRQRAMIAMSLCCDPEILIADEPTTALDVTVQAQVLELFKKLIRQRGMSIIFVTHDLSVIAEIADDVLVLKDGEVVEYAPIDDIFHHPVHPYTQELLSLTRGEVI